MVEQSASPDHIEEVLRHTALMETLNFCQFLDTKLHTTALAAIIQICDSSHPDMVMLFGMECTTIEIVDYHSKVDKYNSLHMMHLYIGTR